MCTEADGAAKVAGVHGEAVVADVAGMSAGLRGSLGAVCAVVMENGTCEQKTSVMDIHRRNSQLRILWSNFEVYIYRNNLKCKFIVKRLHNSYVYFYMRTTSHLPL